MSSILYQRCNAAQYRVAAIIAAVVAVAAFVMAPFAATQVPVFLPFIPMFETTVILVEGLTAFLLGVQFRATKQAYLGGLAGAYGFVMIVAALQLLIFPGVFAKDGLFGAGSQCAVWLWVIWHGGFAGMVLLALLTRTQFAARWFGEALPRAGIGLMAAGPLIGAFSTFLVVHYHNLLPNLIAHGVYVPLREGLISRIVIMMILLTIAACLQITKLRDLLSLWVAVALLASLGDSLLVVLAGARFSLGWYGGRMLNVVSSSTVLCLLVFEFTWAYEQLVSAHNVLKHRVMHDGLTGVFNRVYFSEQFPREMRRSVRERAPLAVLMIDVDHFKQFNDTCGHARGDECLIAVAAALEGAVRRPGDFLARYGGEEFVAVLPHTNREGAMAMAEVMRQEIMRLAMPRGGTIEGIVTVSLGIASMDPMLEEITTDMLLQRADAALYQAKHNGRNQAAVWEMPKVASMPVTTSFGQPRMTA